MFAYDDQARTRLPEALQETDVRTVLAENVWQQKYTIVTDLYGFSPKSWEARSTPRTEAFWRFVSPQAYADWIEKETRRE